MADSDPQATFGDVAKELNRYGLAYLHIIEPRINGTTLVREGLEPVAATTLRQVFTGKIIAAGGFEPDTAEAIVVKGDADLVAFGRHFIANPDLPLRIQNALPLNPYDRATFYGGGERGYVDYPFYKSPGSEMDMPAVAVFGATGHTGRFVVAELLRRGIRPIAIARDPAALAARNFPESKVDRRHATVDRRFSQSVRRNTGGFQVPSSAARKGP